MTAIAITGAAGRMGMRLVALSKQDQELKLVAATERPGHPALGQDVGELAQAGRMGVNLAAEISPVPQVVIDFTAPAATRHCIQFCRLKKIALVIGTTGLQMADQALIDEAAREIPIIQAPNMSLGVNLLLKVCAQVARALGDDYDIEIVEGHHRFKKDAPSGTAMGIADAILTATGKARDALVLGRSGDECTRKRGEIGMHAWRAGDEIGRHNVIYAALGERIEIQHTATNRDTFVLGALKAAKWLAGQKPGRYAMADVLGL